MDYSSLSESQQQLLAQYQQYQQQQLQQQQQQQQQQPQPQPQPQPQDQTQQQAAFDPSQVQAYDPNAQAYYAYQQAYPQQQYAQHQTYPYYATDYASNPYQDPNLVPAQPQPQPQPQPQAQAPHADSSQMMAAPQPQQGAYPPPQDQQGVYPPPQDQQGAYPVPTGLNPAAAAAIAALSQLSQFAGTMDAAERAMQDRQWQDKSGGYAQMPGPPPQQPYPMPHGPPHMGHHNAGRPPFRGGDRRGGGPYRGGGRSGHRPPRQDVGGRPFRGRGGRMGRGGGRRFPPPAAAGTSQLPYLAPEHALEHPAAPFRSSATMPASKQAKAPRQPQVLWCEICRVECNSLEILERHNNGKRHKKTMQRYEEIQKHKRLGSESQAVVTNQVQNVQGGEENKTSAENYPPKDSTPEDALAVANMDENKMNPGQQNQIAEKSEFAKADTNEALGRKRRMDRFDNRRYPPNRKMMKFGRGGKRPKPAEPVRGSESPKDQPTRYCALCNVMCDTQAVFDCHLQGKKHQSRAQRFPVPQAGFVAMGYHAPINSQGSQAEGSRNQEGKQAVSENQAQQDPTAQGQEVTPKSEGKDDMMKNEDGEAVAEPKDEDAVSEMVETQDNTAALTVLEMVGTQDDSAAPSVSEMVEIQDNSTAPKENAFSEEHVQVAVPAPEFGASLADNVVLPGLDDVEGDGTENV